MGTFPASPTTTTDLTATVVSDPDIVTLSSTIARSLPNANIFDQIIELKGEVHRLHKHRRTICAEIGGQRYFVKVHGHSGWKEVLKNIYRLRVPVLTAVPEYRAINKLHELNIPTLECVGCGCRGRNPARLESFIVTEALEDFLTIDELAKSWAKLPETQGRRLLRRAIVEIATIARQLHTNGLNHRDFYLCHFMVRDRDWSTWTPADDMTLHVIDLHRMQIRGRTPLRWLIKDLSGLLFSVLDVELTGWDYLRFLKVYWGLDWKQQLRKTKFLRRIVIARAVTLYRRKQGRPPRLPSGLANFS